MADKQIDLSKLSKLEYASAKTHKPIDADARLEAVFRVKQDDYVPSKVNLRARIDARMFTGTVQAADLKAVETDAKVKAVSVSRKLRMIY